MAFFLHRFKLCLSEFLQINVSAQLKGLFSTSWFILKLDTRFMGAEDGKHTKFNT